jgi:hypothetical protein
MLPVKLNGLSTAAYPVGRQDRHFFMRSGTVKKTSETFSRIFPRCHHLTINSPIEKGNQRSTGCPLKIYVIYQT